MADPQDRPGDGAEAPGEPPAKKAAAKRTPAKQAPAKKASAGKAPAKKAGAQNAPAKKAPARKAPAKKAVPRQMPALAAPPPHAALPAGGSTGRNAVAKPAAQPPVAPAVGQPGKSSHRIPVSLGLALAGLVAVLLVRLLRRRG